MTIKQKIIYHLDAGYALCYGMANQITNSQSGERRLREIIAENPQKYRYVKARSQNGGNFHYYGKPKAFVVIGYSLVARCPRISKKVSDFKTKKEALSHIKKVVR